MGLLDFLFKKSDKTSLSSDELIEAGACPNCWGHQEWDGKFTAYARDRQKDILNGDSTAQKAFVQQFIEDQVTGIRLKADGDKLVCPACKSGYKIKSTHGH